MLEIELCFPTGRYHATPWDHHVNEGIVEWPPSPWRLLRAVVATWYLKTTSEELELRDEEEERLRRIVWSLSSELPTYALPVATAFHTRHYMPRYQGSALKVFDTFLHVGDSAVTLRWSEVELDSAATKLLDRLLSRLAYLGRAESWVEAFLRDVPGIAHADVAPVEGGGDPTDETGIVRVLAPATPADFAAWRAAELSRREQQRLVEKRLRAEKKGRSPEREKLTAKDRHKIGESLPETLFDALHVDTGLLRKAGWSLPPGSRWVSYRGPADRPRATPKPGRRRLDQTAQRTVARFSIASQAPPLLTEAVSVAERFRQGLMSRGGQVPVFTGRDSAGGLLRGHRHAYILAEANGSHGWITHVTLFAEMGFEEKALIALSRLQKVWGHGGHDLQTVLLGVGPSSSFGGRDLVAGECPLLVEAEEWISRTPFVPTRHPKVTRSGRPKLDADDRQVGSPEHDLRRLLKELRDDLPEPVRVEPTSGTRLGGKQVRWSAFRTERKQGGGRRASSVGHGFRLIFPRPVRGPIAVGYGAHFGLGVFVPAIEDFLPLESRFEPSRP